MKGGFLKAWFVGSVCGAPKTVRLSWMLVQAGRACMQETATALTLMPHHGFRTSAGVGELTGGSF